MHHFVKKVFLFLCVFSVTVTGCSATSLFTPSDTRLLHNISADLFEQEMLANTINLHYTLANPAAGGFKDYPVTLGTYSSTENQKTSLYAENILQRMSTISYHTLSEEDALTYDILSHYMSNQLGFADLSLYPEPLSASGVQTELPVLLSEYAFRNEKDIQDYLILLSCIPAYFEDICLYEQEKADAGLFMSDTALDHVLAQCKALTENQSRHFLHITFEERIASADFLTSEEKDAYITQNNTALQTYFFPSYYLLSKELSLLKGTGVNDGGLCNFKHGKKYYEYLVAANTGTDYSIPKLKQILLQQLNKDNAELQSLINQEPALAASLISSTLSTPEAMLLDLYDKIQKDFPKLNPAESTNTADFHIKYVDSSMEDFLSPAFYLTPPIDTLGTARYTPKQSTNVIYINDISSYTDISLYTTLAHEGYPGHLYQTNYFNSQNPPPIRSLLYYGGYTEGWAVYVEQYAYTLAGLDPDLCRVMQLDHSMQLCIYSLLDIMIHYEGLTLNKMNHLLSENDRINQEALQQIYDIIIEEPANYLKYYIGYLEICRLRTHAENTLANHFTLKDFHEFLLSIGPAPFPIIEKREDIWIQDILSPALLPTSTPPISHSPQPQSTYSQAHPPTSTVSSSPLQQ